MLGGGKPVFTTPQQRIDLTLAETRTLDSRVVLLRPERTAHPS
ncbi:hypothetical protein [Streptomyces sp. NPDC053069]